MPQKPPACESEAIAASPSLNRNHTLAVLGIGLALRLLVIWIVLTRFSPHWLFMRGMEMGLLASSLLAGHGLGSPFGGDTGPTAFVAPVYPILVAIVFKVFGSFSVASEIVILLAQTALNLLTVWLVMRIARQLFNQAAATIAGLIWACSLPLLWMPTIFWETSLSCCLLTGLIALVLRYRNKPRLGPVQWLQLGAYCGFVGLVNPALLPSLVAIVLWTAWTTRSQASGRPILAALAFVLVFSPWPIRNALVFHAFIPTRTTVGFELWMGNHPGSTGFLDDSLFPTFNSQELADYNSCGEVAYTSHKSDLARQYIFSHPAIFLSLTLKRAARFILGSGTEHGSIFFAIHATFTTVFGIAGVLLFLRSRRFEIAALFALPLVVFPLPYLITHAEFRYRLVVDPLFTIFAGYAVTQFCQLFVLSDYSSANRSIKQNSLPIHSLPSPNGRIRWRRS